MWAIAGIAAVSVMIWLIEIPSLRKRKLKKEMLVFYILLLIGAGLSVVESLHIKIPNPNDWIIAVFKPISNVLFSVLT